MEARIPAPPFDEGESCGLERESDLLKVIELEAELGRAGTGVQPRVLSPGVVLQRDGDKGAPGHRSRPPRAGPGQALVADYLALYL